MQKADLASIIPGSSSQWYCQYQHIKYKVIVLALSGMQSTNRPPIPPDHNRGPIILAVQFSTLGVAIIVVLLRFYVRLNLRAHGWDDYTIYLALVTSPPASGNNKFA